MSLGAWSQLLRLPNLFTAVADVGAGMSLASPPLPGLLPVVALLAASTSLYAGGIVLNDVFDVEVDRRERPRRPLPSSRIVVSKARRVGVTLLVAGIALAAVAGLGCATIAAAIACLAFAYDAGLKHRPLVGAVALAGCRHLNLLMGLAILPLSPASWLIPLPLTLYVLAIMPMSQVEVEGGDRRAPALSAALLIASLAVAVGLVIAGLLPRAWALFALTLVIGAVLAAILVAFREPTSHRLQSAIRRMLLGLIPLDSTLALCGPRLWPALAIIALLLPARLLARRIPMT